MLGEGPALDVRFALGGRGDRPVHFTCSWSDPRVRGLTSIPGVARVPGGLATTADAAFIVARVLEVPEPDLPVAAPITRVDCPGYERYVACGFPRVLRPYQKADVAFLTRRAYAFNCQPPRTGKTLTAIAASTLVDAERVLIVCPAIAKWVWADEIARWAGAAACVLGGRAADEACVVCLACRGRGTNLVSGAPCTTCSAGGRSRGYRVCRGAEDVDARLAASRFVVCNYDILIAQAGRTATGVRTVREDLPGWGRRLTSVRFDLVIADEAHLLRGRTYDRERIGESRRERFVQVARAIPRAWFLTATPIFSFVADLWGQLDAASGGLWGRKRFDFDVTYCGAYKGEYGWWNEGRANVEDLRRRLSYFMIKRPRAELLADLPAKVRQVQRIECLVPTGLRRAKGAQARFAAEVRVVAAAKRPLIVDALRDELATSTAREPIKVIAYCYMRETAVSLARAVETIIAGRKAPSRLRDLKPAVWCATGEASSHARFEMARAFREYPGPAVLVATIDSVQVALSLRGATTIHFADMHHDPGAMLQAEDRPNEPGTRGLTVVYWVATGTIDEHIIAVALPKIETLERVMAEEDAGSVRVALSQQEETLNEIVGRLTEHLNGGKNAAA